MFNLPNWLRRIRGRKCSRCSRHVTRYVIVSGAHWCERCMNREPAVFLEQLKAEHATLEASDNIAGLGFSTVPPHSARLIRVTAPLRVAVDGVELDPDNIESEIHRTAW